jgi:hypothetical protein
LTEPTRQRQQILLERLSGLGDDLAIARLNLAPPDIAGAVAALGRGRAIVLNLAAAIAAQDNRPDLGEARIAWRIAQGAADKAEEKERAVAAARGDADATDLAEARDAAVAARAAVHENFRRFHEVLRKAGLDQLEAVDIAELANAIPAGGALVMPVIPSHGEGCALILAARKRVPEQLPLPGLTHDWLSEQLREWFAGYDAFHEAAAATDKGVARADIDAWNRVMAAVLTEIGRVLMAPIDHFLQNRLKLTPEKLKWC